MISDSILIFDRISFSAYSDINSASLYSKIASLASFSHRICRRECGMTVTSRVVIVPCNIQANGGKATNRHMNYLNPAPPTLQAYEKMKGAVSSVTEIAYTSPHPYSTHLRQVSPIKSPSLLIDMSPTYVSSHVCYPRQSPPSPPSPVYRRQSGYQPTCRLLARLLQIAYPVLYTSPGVMCII
jgi:hypothetical protein